VVRELGPKEYKNLTLLKSSVKEIEDIRRWGIFLCQGYEKKALLPDPHDIRWFWSSMEYIEDGDALAKEVLLAKPELRNYYQFDKLNWTRAFKDFLMGDDEALRKKLYGTGAMDLILFFSLLWPFPKLEGITFWNFTTAAYSLKKPEYRKQIADYIIKRDPGTLEKMEKGEVIPWYYTRNISYQTLHRLVLRRLSENPDIGPIMKEALKLKEKGIEVTFEETPPLP